MLQLLDFPLHVISGAPQFGQGFSGLLFLLPGNQEVGCLRHEPHEDDGENRDDGRESGQHLPRAEGAKRVLEEHAKANADRGQTRKSSSEMRLRHFRGVDTGWCSHHTRAQTHQQSSNVDHVDVRGEGDEQPAENQWQFRE